MSTESTEPKPCAWLAMYAGIRMATTDEATAIRWRNRVGAAALDLFDRAELDAAVARAVAEERERCAKLCETFAETHLSTGSSARERACAELIRRPTLAAWNPHGTTDEHCERVIQREEPCGSCNGSGRMVRDPDIGTDQECFVCDGSGRISDA